MVETLEQAAGKSGSIKFVNKREYSTGNSEHNEAKYSAFAEMYLEKPVDAQAANATCSVCTWRGIPTIDDW